MKLLIDFWFHSSAEASEYTDIIGLTVLLVLFERNGSRNGIDRPGAGRLGCTWGALLRKIHIALYLAKWPSDEFHNHFKKFDVKSQTRKRILLGGSQNIQCCREPSSVAQDYKVCSDIAIFITSFSCKFFVALLYIVFYYDFL